MSAVCNAAVVYHGAQLPSEKVRVCVASTWQRRGDCCAVHVRHVENSSCGGSAATVAAFKPVKLNGSSLSMQLCAH